MERIICLVVGYAFGLIESGYLYGKMNGIDIRQHGSGNSGTTNALRVLGKKAGLVVFIGDVLKTMIPCVAVRLLFRGDAPMGYLLTLYTGLGVILGHNYPFYLKFQGGKGIAATAGILTSLDLRLMVICLISFVLVVAVSRYVSLGSLVVAVIFLVWNWVMAGSYGIPQAGLTDYYIVAAAISALAFWRHKANIVRLAHGTENKLWGSKK